MTTSVYFSFPVHVWIVEVLQLQMCQRYDEETLYVMRIQLLLEMLVDESETPFADILG